VEIEETRALTVAVYPPEEWVNWHGHQVEWSKPQWSVRVRDHGGQLVSYIGVYVCEATLDGNPVRIGGIGGVKTHPDARGRGFAGRGLRKAMEFLTEQQVAFGQLVCEPHLISYYTRFGWQEFSGQLLVRQRGDTVAFTFGRVMTRSFWSAAPISGVIDLCGQPW